MGASAVIMDIGSKYTKLCVATSIKGKAKISKATHIKSPNDYVLRDKGWQQQLQVKISEMKVKGKSLRVILNRDNINVIVGEDTITTKGLNAKAIKMGIQNKILNLTPDKSIMVNDWYVIAENEDTITYEYAIIRKDVIDMIEKIAKDNKLNLVSIDIRMSSVVNFYKLMKEKGKFAEQDEDTINCLLYIGTKNYNLIGFTKEGIIYTKAESNDLATLDTDLLMSQDSNNMSDGSNIGFNADGSFAFDENATNETSFTLKEQIGFRFNPEVTDAYNDYKRRVESGLVIKVSRQLDKMMYKGKRVGINKLYLIGSSSKLPHIDEYFANQLGAEVEIVNMDDYIVMDNSINVPNCEDMDILPEMYAIAVGNIKGV